MDKVAELRDLARQLRAEGHAAAAREIQAIRRELVLLDKPPAWFARVGGRLAGRMRPHLGRLSRELAETRDAGALLARAARRGPGSLSAAERARLRAQLGDLLKTVPGVAIFVGLFFVPVPGAQALTPLFLSRLQLLPTAWRETYVLHALDAAAARFREAGDEAAARSLDGVRGRLVAAVEERAALQRFLAADPDFTLLFDDDFDGRLDAAELATAHARLDQVRAVAAARGSERIWFTWLGGAILGPYRLEELAAGPDRERALVSYEKSGHWAPLGAVLEAPTQKP